jgi:hypothetical protein
MTFELLADAKHTCTLPDPDRFVAGAEIRCTEPVLRNGNREACGRRYWRATRFWFNRPYWSDDWGW